MDSADFCQLDFDEASPLLRLGASDDVSRCRHLPNIRPAQTDGRSHWHLQFVLSDTHTLGHTKAQLTQQKTTKSDKDLQLPVVTGVTGVEEHVQLPGNYNKH